MVKTNISKKGSFNIFVDKLSKKKGNIIYGKEIEKIASQLLGEHYSRTKGYKLVHQANLKGHLIILKKDVYYIPHQGEQIDDIIQKWYRVILHNHIKEFLGGKGIITGETALNLLLQNYEIPDMIPLISLNKQCQEVILRDKITAIKKMTSNKQSLFPTLKKTAKKISVRGKSFYVTSLTVSLLETFFANNNHSLTTQELGKKILRKYWKQLDWEEVIMLLRKGKYHTSINKLYALARGIDETYADHIMNIIKKHSYRISF